MTATSQLFVGLYDTHWPKTNRRVLTAVLNFLRDVKVAGLVWGGDQFDNQSLSPHTKGKPLLIDKGAHRRDQESFDAEVLKPVEALLPRNCQRIWIEGNHDHWVEQYIESHPQLQGQLERPQTLRLKQRGWEVVECGRKFKHGKLNWIHGETLTGIGNYTSTYHAKKAVESYCGNIVYGHVHSPQSYTKVLPHNVSQKWMAYCVPILGSTNPGYLRNRPTAWLNGFVVVEYFNGGNFNVYPIVVTDGAFSYGGKVYRA